MFAHRTVALTLVLLASALRQNPESRTATQPQSQPQAPQSQPQSRPGPVADLAARVAAAQRRDTAPKEVGAFRAFLTIDPVKGDTALQFRGRLAYSRPGMIHFRLAGDPKITEAMFDGTAYWQVDKDGRAEELTRKETKSTRDEMDRRLTLCEQIARLLFVDQAMLRMKDAQLSDVDDYRQPGDKTATPAVLVRGTLDDYPLYHAPDYTGRVALQLWLRKDGLRPLALRATPLDKLPAVKDEPPRRPFTEELEFSGLELASGVEVPDEIRLYLVDARGQQALRFSARVDELELNPALTRADFQPRKK